MKFITPPSYNIAFTYKLQNTKATDIQEKHGGVSEKHWGDTKN